MALQSNGPAPYTTVAAATTVLHAYRDRGLSKPLSPEVLIRAGIQESLARRTMQSLKLLELVDDAGNPTQQFEDLRQARGDDEYQTRLQEWLRGVYAEVLQYTDPSTDSQDRVAEAFRTYEPAGQRRSMASLLIGLWKHSGLPTPEGTAKAPTKPRESGMAARNRFAQARTGQRFTGKRGGGAAGPTGVPPAVRGLLESLPNPPETGWTPDERERFLATFETVLDYSYPVRDADEGKTAGNGEAGVDSP